MKTIQKALLVFTILSMALISCSKDDEPITPEPTPTPKSYDIKGYYKGTYGNGAANTGFGLCFVVEESGKITLLLNRSKFNGTLENSVAYGTYGATGNDFSSLIVTALESLNLSGNFDPTTGKLSGNITSNSGFNGKFTAQKDISGKESLTGYWSGNYTGLSNVKYPCCMIVEGDGTIVFVDGNTFTGAGTSTAYGTNALNSNSFTGNYKYYFGTLGGGYSLKADFADGKLNNGTFGSGANTSGSGTWTMTKMYY